MISHLNPFFLIATLFYLGRVPYVRGVLATIIALITALIIVHYYGTTILLLATIGLFFLGLIAAYNFMKSAGGAEEVVIDEVVGMWVVLLIADALGYPLDAQTCIAALIGFNLFDAWKPWPIGETDRYMEGGSGVMLDDIIAAVYGVMGMAVMLFFYTKLLT